MSWCVTRETVRPMGQQMEPQEDEEELWMVRNLWGMVVSCEWM